MARRVLIVSTVEHGHDVLQEHVGTGLHSHPRESEGAFRARLAEAVREQRDAKIDAIRKRYASRLTTQQDRIRRAEQQLGKQQEEVTSSTGSATRPNWKSRIGSRRQSSTGSVRSRSFRRYRFEHHTHPRRARERIRARPRSQ